MITNTQFTEADIRKLVDEYLGSDHSLKSFCLASELDEAHMQAWLDQYSTEQPGEDNPFYIGNIKEGMIGPVRDMPSKPAPKKPQQTSMPTLFARVCDIEIYKEVSAAYLKSLKP